MTDISRSQAWLESLRPKTLPLAFAAIIVGTVLAWEQGHFDPWVALLALITAGFVYLPCGLGDALDAVFGEFDVHPFGRHQRLVLHGDGGIRLGQDAS